MKRVGDFSELKLQPGYPDFDTNAEGVTCELVYGGTYDLCQARKPAVGAQYPGFGNLAVDRARVRKLPGGMGQLRVILSNQGSAGTGGGEDAKPVFEVYWMDLVKSLKQHPMYATSGGAQVFADSDWIDIANWEAETDRARKVAFKYGVFDAAGNLIDEPELSDQAKHMARKLIKGRDSYTTCYAVAVQITHHRGTMTLSKCPRKVSAKPFDACPDGYNWLRWSDRLSRTGKRGKWQRMKIYYGFEEDIDPDLYAVDV